MRGLLLVTAVLTGLVLGIPAANAGDYHHGGGLVCSDCHVMHYSQTHGYNSDGTGDYAPLGGSGPYEKLLRNTVTDLCLSCHDNSALAPDIAGVNSNGYYRMAGGLNREDVAPYYHETGHTLEAIDTAPGGTWSDADGFTCTHCHEQHGYHPDGNAYRNLRHNPGTVTGVFVDYAIGTNDTDMDVFERALTPMATHYGIDNVDFNEPDATASSYAEFCQGCHTDFHGGKGSVEMGGATGVDWLRHPNADADIGAVGDGTHSSLATFSGHTNRVKVMSPTGVWDPPPSSVTPSCFSCHKAHGNQNAFGLIHMAGTGTVTEEGDDGTAIQDVCGQCHIQ